MEALKKLEALKAAAVLKGHRHGRSPVNMFM